MALEDISLDDMLGHAGEEDPMDAIRGRRRGSIFGLGRKKKLLGPDVDTPMGPVTTEQRTYNGNWAPMAAVAAPAPAGVPEAPAPAAESVPDKPYSHYANNPDEENPYIPVERRPVGLGEPPKSRTITTTVGRGRNRKTVTRSRVMSPEELKMVQEQYPEFTKPNATYDDLDQYLQQTQSAPTTTGSGRNRRTVP